MLDLITAVIALGAQLANTDLPKKLAGLESAIARYVNVFRGNVEAATEAAALAPVMADGFRKNLRRQQLKALLLDRLKGSDSKSIPDEAEINQLLRTYEPSFEANKDAADNRARLLLDATNVYRDAAHLQTYYTAFEVDLARARHYLQVELPTAIANLNASQGSLLNRMNEIYDHSEVHEPMVKQIDLSGHSGNLVVYYTIRRIDNFQRYTVAQVQRPGGATPVAEQNAALPSSASAVPAGTTPAQATTGGNATTATAVNMTTSPSSSTTTLTATTTAASSGAASTTEGTVVAQGSFEVHDVFQANVIAAVAFSTLQDQSITKLAAPMSCGGSGGNPDPNCFSPQVRGSYKWTPIVGLDFYFHPRDTFPRSSWACGYDWLQCFGVMGAASVTKANNYFFGGFFEPALGVQFGAGANFGTKTVLQSPYEANKPADITGDFPTTERRGTGFFISAGLDLGIFRKIFGKFTGIGTSASGTSGQ